jgi:hypothetical protein
MLSSLEMLGWQRRRAGGVVGSLWLSVARWRWHTSIWARRQSRWEMAARRAQWRSGAGSTLQLSAVTVPTGAFLHGYPDWGELTGAVVVAQDGSKTTAPANLGFHACCSTAVCNQPHNAAFLCHVPTPEEEPGRCGCCARCMLERLDCVTGHASCVTCAGQGRACSACDPLC